MADKDITIGIKTTGAETAAGQIRRVEDATEDLSRAQRQADLSPDKARVSEFAYYDLGAEIDKTRQKTETFTSGVTQLQQPTRNSATALLMFSQGFEDAQYGIRGVLNNIPGLIIALGGTAGLAGAISIAAVTLSQIIPLFSETEEKASDMADRIKTIADNMGAMETDRFEKVGAGIESAREAAEALQVQFGETQKAEAQFAVAALDNAAKIKLAEENIATALGLQVDSKKELSALADAEAAKRELLAQQAIDLEKQRLAEAEETATKAADILSATKQRYDIESANLVQLRGQLEALREQKKELEQLAKGGGSPGAPNFFAPGGGIGFDPGQKADNDLASSAFKRLNSPEFQTALQGMQARVDSLEELVLGITEKVPRAENSLNAANAAVADLSEAVETSIKRIEETLAADTLVAKSETLVATGEKFAKDIETAFGKVEASTAAGTVAKDSLLSAAADGKITADEMASVAKNMQVLMGQIQSGQAMTAGNMRELITLQQEFLRAGQVNAIQIQQLKVQAQQQAAAINQLYSRIR